MIKTATAWYRFKDGKWQYNHFEYGINQGTPKSESERQKVWSNWIWAKKYGYYQKALGKTKLVTISPLILYCNRESQIDYTKQIRQCF